MIELRTGIPGSGKTLSLVEALSRLLASWAKNPELGRSVFVHNIKDLALSHAVMPTKDVQVGNQIQSVPDWDNMPAGSLVIMDECQDMLPPRSTQSKPPAHIAWFNTHRHHGFDVWLVTQHPKLIDGAVRALVGKHVHFRRLFGGARAATYEWDACSDNLSGMKNAVIGLYNFPKKAFQWYKSAEVHNKQSFKLPRWLIIPALGLAFGAFMLPRAYTVLTSAAGGHGLAQAATLPAGTIKPLTGVSSPADQAAALRPPLVPPVQSRVDLAALAGCALHPVKGCICFGAKGQPVDYDEYACQSVTDPRHVLTEDELPGPSVKAVFNAGDESVLSFMHKRKTLHY